MPNSIFVNLIVADLSRAKNFFVALGFTINEGFANDEAAGLMVNDFIYVMLHTSKSIRRFTRKELVNSNAATEVLIALQVDSKKEVDDLLEKAIAADATEYRGTEDHEFMYGRSFEDLDGHIWEVFWMNPEGIAETNKA